MDVVPTYRSRAKIPGTPKGATITVSSSIATKVSIENHSITTVHSRDRTGLVTRHHKNFTSGGDQFLRLVQEITIRTSNRKELEAALCEVNEELYPLSKTLKEAYERECLQNPHSRQQNKAVNLTLYNDIAINDLRAYGGSIYIRDLDLIISINEAEAVPIHPDLIKQSSASLSKDSGPDSKRGFIYYKYIIPENSAPSAIYVALPDKTILPVEGVKVPALEPGVYRHYSSTVSEQGYPVSGNIVFLGNNLDELKQHSVFKTADDAFNSFVDPGETERKYKLRIAELEREAQILKANSVVEEAKRKQEEQAREEQLSIVKNNLDMKSYERKDTSEGLKLFTMVLGGVAAIYGIVRKIS